MKGLPVRELQGMNPHVLHLSQGTLYIIPTSTARSRCMSYMCILAFVLRKSLFESDCLFPPFKLKQACATGSGNLSTGTPHCKFFFFFNFIFLKWETWPECEGAVLAGENISHEWKCCSVSLRLPQSPSRRRRHNGPQCAFPPPSVIRHR